MLLPQAGVELGIKGVQISVELLPGKVSIPPEKSNLRAVDCDRWLGFFMLPLYQAAAGKGSFVAGTSVIISPDWMLFGSQNDGQAGLRRFSLIQVPTQTAVFSGR